MIFLKIKNEKGCTHLFCVCGAISLCEPFSYSSASCSSQCFWRESLFILIAFHPATSEISSLLARNPVWLLGRCFWFLSPHRILPPSRWCTCGSSVWNIAFAPTFLNFPFNTVVRSPLQLITERRKKNTGVGPRCKAWGGTNKAHFKPCALAGVGVCAWGRWHHEETTVVGNDVRCNMNVGRGREDVHGEVGVIQIWDFRISKQMVSAWASQRNNYNSFTCQPSHAHSEGCGRDAPPPTLFPFRQSYLTLPPGGRGGGGLFGRRPFRQGTQM